MEGGQIPSIVPKNSVYFFTQFANPLFILRRKLGTSPYFFTTTNPNPFWVSAYQGGIWRTTEKEKALISQGF